MPVGARRDPIDERLTTWPAITSPVASEQIRLECLRTIDRARIRLGLPDPEVARLRSDVLEALEAFTLVALDPVVLERASVPFPTMLGSLDPIHLATALLVREQRDNLEFATHDEELASGAIQRRRHRGRTLPAR